MLNLIPPDNAPGAPGWPWSADGLWSVAADFGPLLLSGAIFAYGTEAITRSWTGVRGRRLPLALFAALAGWIPLSDGPHGLLEVSGWPAFIAMVIATRLISVRERRSWTRAKVAATAVAAVALACASLSYGFLHPLRAGDGGAVPAGPGVYLTNDGPSTARILDVSVPGQRVTRLLTDAPSGTVAASVDGLVRPFGTPTLAPGDNRVVYLAGACGPIDRVVVRLRVSGRTVTQHLPVADARTHTCG
jgi:hypothetical protein